MMTLRVLPNPEPGPPEVDVAETARIRAAGAQLVDVREPEEWVDEHIPGAIHIPLGELWERATELDRTRAVVTICRSGQRSLYAADMLLHQGFGEVASLNGGMIAWNAAGQPSET